MANISYYLLKGLVRSVGALPLKLHYLNANLLAVLARKFYRTEVVRDNLRRSFPEKSEEEREEILRKFYRHFADLAVETIWFGSSNVKRLERANIAEVLNPEVLNEVYSKSESVFVMYSHAGNWELLGGIAAYLNGKEFCVSELDYCAVYKKMHSEAWDRLMIENRIAPVVDKANYDGLIESMALIRYVINHKGEKKIFTVNTDQHPYKNSKGSVMVRFMGQETASMAAVANLAAKFHLPVVYQSMMIPRRGHYTIEYIPICDDASQMPVEEIMQKYYDLLEADIRKQPENYLWTHRRWKKY